MEEFRVLTPEFLEANKNTNFYEFKKNPEFTGWSLPGPSEPVYIGKYINRTTGGSSNNYYFIYKFEKKSLNTAGEDPKLNEYLLRIVEERPDTMPETGGKKGRLTRKNKKSNKSKKSKKSKKSNKSKKTIRRR